MSQKHTPRATNATRTEEEIRKEKIRAFRRKRIQPQSSFSSLKRTLRKSPETLYHPRELWKATPSVMKLPAFLAIFILVVCFSIVSSMAAPIEDAFPLPQRNGNSDDWFESSLRGSSTALSAVISGRKDTLKFPFGCVSNQQCIMDSVKAMDGGLIDAPLPYCWVNGECRGERQLVMHISSSEEKNGTSSTPYPVFHQGEEMCVTIIFNPSLVLFDDLWNVGEEEEEDVVSQQQQRLLLFQSLPLRITLDRMWMCSSKKKVRDLHSSSMEKHEETTDSIVPELMTMLAAYGGRDSVRETEEEKDVVPHTYIRHHDQSQWETGCLTNHPSIRKWLVYGGESTNVHLSRSVSGLSSKICFPAKALGLPDVPCFIDAEVSVQIQRKLPDQDLTPYEEVIRAFALDPSGKTLPPLTKDGGEEPKESDDPSPPVLVRKHEECTSVEERPKRRHGNRDHKVHKRVENQCKDVVVEEESRKRTNDVDDPFGVPATKITVTSSDTLTPHPETSRVSRGALAGRDSETTTTTTIPRARTVGYYYYYDPEARGYYYYHPHVHCDWDLTFNQGAGICEPPGRLHSDTTHIFVIVLATLGIGIGLVFFVMDWKSRVLFVRDGL